MNTQGEEAWRDYLHGLPAVVPPARLRSRVLQAWQPAIADRSRRRWLLPAAAAAAALALVLAPPWNARPDPAPSPVPTGVAPAPPADPLLASQRLEQRLLASPAAGDPALQAGIAEIDRALGAAYRRGAAGEELDGLWRARTRALEQGLAAAPPQPLRI